MNRRERRAARARARQQTVVGSSALDAMLDRLHIFQANQREADEISRTLGEDDVILICDSRDPVARMYVLAAGRLTEEQLREQEAPMVLGRLIPTFIFGIPKRVAIDLTATFSPDTSETIEAIGGILGRTVLVISAGGTLMIPLATSCPDHSGAGGA